MDNKPWIEGPLELLHHGLEHLKSGHNFDNRIAMISIDNAIELTIKTYLGLPSRINGIKGLGRKRFAEACQDFPSTLDCLEEFASDKLAGVELGDIEWFHRLRNQLYHDGNGITVEKEKVQAYAELAKILFVNLFDISKEINVDPTPDTLAGMFFQNWSKIDQYLFRLNRFENPDKHFAPPEFIMRKLVDTGLINEKKTRRLQAS